MRRFCLCSSDMDCDASTMHGSGEAELHRSPRQSLPRGRTHVLMNSRAGSRPRAEASICPAPTPTPEALTPPSLGLESIFLKSAQSVSLERRRVNAGEKLAGEIEMGGYPAQFSALRACRLRTAARNTFRGSEGLKGIHWAVDATLKPGAICTGSQDVPSI